VVAAAARERTRGGGGGDTRAQPLRRRRTPTLPTNSLSDTHTGWRSSFSLRTARRASGGAAAAAAARWHATQKEALLVSPAAGLHCNGRGARHAARDARKGAPVASTFTSDMMRS
jgi:hypothetical protein